jgi:hypothetical protein
MHVLHILFELRFPDMKVIWGWTLSVKWVNPLVEQEFKKAQKVVGGIV